MIKKQLFVMVAGLNACMLSQTLWATCNANITITKPDSIYIDHLDGTVSDSETGLMWQKCSLGQTWSPGVDVNSGSDDSCENSATTHSWQVALAKANEDISYTYSDWRLPNKNELKSLVEKACLNPAINKAVFPNTVPNWYWSASPYAVTQGFSWIVSFHYGFDFALNRSSGFYVRLVRDPI